MDIAIVGAPQSGKTKFAHELSAALDLENSIVIDGYAYHVGQDSGLALGDAAGYIGNLLVLAERLKYELSAMKSEHIEHTIVCGTLIDTITYMSVHAALYTGKRNRDGQEKIASFMHLCGAVFTDMFVYDYVFYLPLPESVQDDELRLFDTELRRALEMFWVKSVTLEGTVEEQVEKAVDQIATPKDAVPASS